MKFNRLRLTNIGAFYGNHDFDLRTGPSPRNIVLIGGKNGSGKTTILESIRLALYGPIAFGYKTETTSYFEKVKQKLNTVAINRNENLFHIILDFEIVENLERYNYVLRRAWIRSGTNLKEELTIQRNNRELSTYEREIFLSKIREEWPPQLLEFFLFDGEKISQVISDDVLSKYLKESAKVMFNLDLFETLEIDLHNFIRQGSINRNLNDEEKKLITSREKLENLVKQRNNLLKAIEKIREEKDENHALLKTLNKEYEINGGLLREERDKLLQEMNKIEQQRGAMMENNKEMISTILPFCLVRDLLAEVVSQMEKEAAYETAKNFNKFMNMSTLINTLIDLQKNGSMILRDDTEIVAQQILNSLTDIAISDVPLIHRASTQQRLEVSNLYKETLEFNAKKIIDNFNKNELLMNKVRELRQKISLNDSVHELKSLLEKINEIDNKLKLLNHREEQLKIQLTILEEEICNEEKNLQNLNSMIIAAKKSNNIFVLTNKIIEISRRFREIQLKKKLQQVEIETAKMLQKLFRKELFVIGVFIHPETFTLKLYSDNNIEINKENLSAGEKQILLLATIWAFSKCSKRKLPFIFDTLFGRMDQTHKKRIIQYLLPECGEQVLILSTDSEVDFEHFNILQPIIARTYTIEFNSEKSTVVKTLNYFNYYIEDKRIDETHEFSVKDIKINS